MLPIFNLKVQLCCIGYFYRIAEDEAQIKKKGLATIREDI